MAVLLLPPSALHQRRPISCSDLKEFRPLDGSETPGMPLHVSSRHGSETPGMPLHASRSLRDFRVSDGSRTPATVTPAMMSQKLIDFRVSDGTRTPASMNPQFFNTPTPCRSPSSSSVLFPRKLGPRRNTMGHSALSPLPPDPFHLQDSTPASGDACIDSNNPQSILRSTLRPTARSHAKVRKSCFSVAVVAPGGGTGINSSVYSALDREDDFSVKILGQSRAAYDRYPTAWGGDGAPAPNLETFALDLVAQKCVEQADCLIVGSRGGQVVLPVLWQAQAKVPPTIVMNGGCAASSLPISVAWPESAVTFLLIGGNDYFKGNFSSSEYLQDTQRRVPRANPSTAILLVNEMTHMPQAQLLTTILGTMICALMSWKSSGEVPRNDLKTLLATLRQGRWTGVLSLKTTPGDRWDVEFFP